MADNMESFLLGNDDSSSGESDSEVAVGSNSAANKAAPAPAPPQKQQQRPTSSSSNNSNMSQSEISQRLKSLYSPAAKQPGQQQPKPQSQPPPQHQQQRPPPQHQQQQPHPSQQQQRPPPSSHPSHAPSTQQQQYRPPSSSSSMQGHPSQQQHPMSQQHRSSSSGMQRSTSASRSSGPPPPSSRGVHPGHHAPPQPPHPGAGLSRQPSRMPPVADDPYAPTPVNKLMQKPSPYGPTAAPTVSQHHCPPQQPPSSARSIASSSHQSSASRQYNSSTANEAEIKKNKEKFLIFTRVLLKYLESKDPPLQKQVKAIIKDCADRNKRGERGYESVTMSMRSRLKAVVNEGYWKRAEGYLEHFLKNNKNSANARKRPQGQQQPQQRPPGSNALQQQQQQRPPLLQQQQQQLQRLPDASKGQQLSSGSSHPASMPKPGPYSTSQGSISTTASNRKTQKQSNAMVPATIASTVPSGGTFKRKTSLGGVAPSTTTSQQRSTESTSELVEVVTQAYNLDWKSVGLTLGPQLHQSLLAEEQKRLLYYRPHVQKQQLIAAASVNANNKVFPLAGWRHKHVISVRTAWARVRLREQRIAMAEAKKQGQQQPSIPPLAVWHNEETAERDAALAALSYGAQQYLKDVIQKALHCARQRQGIDGVRLWHEQVVAAANPSSSYKPPLAVRLGCDVSRQVALVESNAARTVCRMEEALARHTEHDEPNADPESALSMSDWSLLPRLPSAMTTADRVTKEQLDVYRQGFKRKEPPLGRLSTTSRPTVQVCDLEVAQQLGYLHPRKRCKAMSTPFMF